MTEPSQPPLLRLTRARIDAGGGPLADSLEVRAAGPRVALIGPWEALFRLLTGEAELVAGEATLAGVAVTDAAALGVVGVARTGAPMPPDFRVADYLIESARLAGLGRQAPAAADRALSRLGLESLSRRPVRGLTLVEHRAISIAHAVVTDPPVLAVEVPLDELDPAGAAALAAVLDRASAERALVVSCRQVAPATSLAALVATCPEVFRLDARGEVHPWSPLATGIRPGQRYAITVLDGATRLADALVAAGLHLEREVWVGDRALEPPAGAAPQTPDRVPDEPGGRLVVRLPETAATDLVLRAAHELGCAVVELYPLGVGEASPP